MSTSNTAYNADEPIYTSAIDLAQNFAPKPKSRCKDLCKLNQVKRNSVVSLYCSFCDLFISRDGAKIYGSTGLQCKCCKYRVRTKSTRKREYGK